MKQELPNYQNKIIRSFGRIKSRKLSINKKKLLEEFLPKILLNKNFYPEINKHKNSQNNILEIGYGFGDFLFNLAKNNQQKKIYGFEPDYRPKKAKPLRSARSLKSERDKPIKFAPKPTSSNNSKGLGFSLPRFFKRN